MPFFHIANMPFLRRRMQPTETFSPFRAAKLLYGTPSTRTVCRIQRSRYMSPGFDRCQLPNFLEHGCKQIHPMVLLSSTKLIL
ncbi:hypothetical protein TNCV_36601 [Trichonephila clavipes]|nr:hypothetical protein TNCV_36601 [Trichonephila clavipes]